LAGDIVISAGIGLAALAILDVFLDDGARAKIAQFFLWCWFKLDEIKNLAFVPWLKREILGNGGMLYFSFIFVTLLSG